MDYWTLFRTFRRCFKGHSDDPRIRRVPLNENGEPSSVGSIAHWREEKCKPCIFFKASCGCEKGG